MSSFAMLVPPLRSTVGLAVTSMILAGVILSICQASSGDVPDPDNCSVEPWDSYEKAFVSPGSPPGSSAVDEMIVTVQNAAAEPIAGAGVRIIVASCSNLCVDPVEPGLGPEYTDSSGVVVLNPHVGGCDECIIEVRANDVTIRDYQAIASPDWDGESADGRVDEADAEFFYSTVDDQCVDYNGNGACDAADVAMFTMAFGDENPSGSCLQSRLPEQQQTLDQLMLLAPSPNPVTDALTYQVTAQQAADVRIEVLDMGGRHVATLLDQRLGAGRHTFRWEPTQDGNQLASGVYYLRLETEREHSARMFVLLRR